MTNFNYSKEIAETLEKIGSFHYTNGSSRQNTERLKAQNCYEHNELKAIYHLVESHMPSLRMKTILRCEKILTSEANKTQVFSNKNNVAFKCTTSKIDNNINELLRKIEEMPAEWTLIQLTPEFEKENIHGQLNKHATNSLYLTVFHCGQNQPKPFCVYIDAPRDPVTGSRVQLVKEIHNIMNENRNVLSASAVKSRFLSVPEKQNYYANRRSIDDQLKMLVKELSDLYLKEWKCFFIGKYINRTVELKIEKSIKEFFKAEFPGMQLDQKTLCILQYLIKAGNYLKLPELKKAIQTIIPGESNKKIQKHVAQFVRNILSKLPIGDQKRHPVILILDQTLDYFPWEMMDILSEAPVSRLPSVHLAYSLFREHKETIKNGFKIIENPDNGKFVVNPDTDLKSMQNRILSFYEYWLPTWKGVSGSKTKDHEIIEMLDSCEIFAYNGHGNGSHIFPMHKIEKNRVNAVVLLFGCSSSKLNILGPTIEMYGASLVYIMASSPCVVGNLWEVTDLDTDMLTTHFLSTWIPNSNQLHWKDVDKTVWKKGEKVKFSGDESLSGNCIYEPELLKALGAARKSNQLSFYITRAGIVARGIPVRIQTK